MEMDKIQMIRETLDQREALRRLLFIRGFLLTNDTGFSTGGFPFYGQWRETKLGNFCMYTHKDTGFHYIIESDKIYFLAGHAYNPFRMEHEEGKILEYIAQRDAAGMLQNALDELTGIFLFGVISQDTVAFQVDVSGLQSAYYGCCGRRFFLTSHPQMAGDLYGLEQDGFAQKLISYKWYKRVKGGYLPADLSAFRDIRRIVPNHAYTWKQGTISHFRFYPLKEAEEYKTPEEYNNVIERAADLLRRSMELTTRKWKHPYISLSGGVDSNTTFAAANGVYDRVKAFSYLSARKESIDVEAAVKIAGAFDVPITVLEVPEDEDTIKDYPQIAAIIDHNNGYVCEARANEYRKRIYLIHALAEMGCDVEVKSWVSETIRAYWYKHFNRRRMPKLSAKMFRNLYKLFFCNRTLAHEVDSVFEAYIQEFEYEKIPGGYDMSDFFYSEVSLGSWAGPLISEMKLCTDMTVIYNNRMLLDMLLRVPLEMRISDRHHMDLKKLLNRDLFDMNIRVKNMTETDLRAFLLNCIFTANMLLP